MIEFRHIAVEGVPGAGKTTIATALAERIGARLVRDPGDNPFLEDFHRDMAARAFPTQLYFLLSRYRLQSALRQPDLFRYNLVADFIFERDEIYAALTLGEDEKQLFRQLYALLGERQTLPDLVVYLQLSPREAERRSREIEPAFMRLLADSYSNYFFTWTKTPLLVVKADEFDPVARDGELTELVRVIESHSASPRAGAAGTLYYTPLAGRGA